jgi:sterol desaturase/sphingolipid hydroxylase (fatty acid hydroxylase superfamily)
LLPALGVPGWPAAIVGFLVLDLAVYAQHAALHFVPPLWRLHRVHHADGDIDVSTGVRFHPGEIVLSQAWKIAVVLVIGVPAVAVLVFEIVLSAGALFAHANIRLPRAVDSALRLLIVTPDMHRVHHSTTLDECNSNFGFNVSIWDRLFGTYHAQPSAGHEAMTIGLASYRDAAATRLTWLLGFPFARGPAA